jgi:putative DNA primase/helicase
MCRCPAHDDHVPSLSVRPGRTRLLLHCFAGCDAAAILRVLDREALLEPGGAPAGESRVRLRHDARTAAAVRLWSEARPIAVSPAQAYLVSRGLQANSPELRYHPRTPCGSELRPALIAAVRDNSGLVGIHRTFIDHRSSALAALAVPRRSLGRLGSGAVRLGGRAARLGLAEGIETALSATALFGVPCWAALGAERFHRVLLPPEVEELLLFIDNDAAGRRAERLARETFRHLPVEVHVPARPGDDWNDVLRDRQHGAARTRERRKREGG